MNIIVKTYSGRIIVRPDTTWEKDNEDFYPPDFVSRMTFTPVITAKICKPGRSIGLKFAGRYFDLTGFGMLIYPENMIDGSTEGFACASCLDHTSFLPAPRFKAEEISAENKFSISKDGKEIYSEKGYGMDMIEQAIFEATSKIYIRTGDLMAIELAERNTLTENNNAKIEGLYEGHKLLDFNIIVK